MRIFFLLFLFLMPLILTLILTPLVQLCARKIKAQDFPAPPLKNHRKPTPLLGGVGIFLSLLSTVVVFGILTDFNLFETCTVTFGRTQCSTFDGLLMLIGILTGCFALLVGGVLDDKYNLSPCYQIIWPVLATLVVILAGVGQDNITNPLYYLGLSSDPLLHLKVGSFTIFGVELKLFTDLFTFVWLLLLIYAMKFLDGLNGLVSGITVIGGAILFLTSLALGQMLPAALSLILFAAYAGFLPYNFLGKIFLGESGSTLSGFLLGVLALLGPAKITVTLLILGIPILDLLYVIYERACKAKKSPFQGDLRHLHFKLLERGMTRRQAVLVLWLISLCFGVGGFLVKELGQWFLIAVLIVVAVFLIRYTRKSARNNT